jgi:hypothetical protein
MTSSEHDYSADERFERLLIDSAQSDELPSNVDAAWHKFGAAVSGVSLLAAGAGGALAVQRAQRWLAAKWLVWGVLTGSALTALSLRSSHVNRAVPSAALSASVAVPSATSNTPTAGIEIVTRRLDPASTPAPKATPHSSRLRAPASHSKATPPATSTLTAQVALLDAARTAAAAGAFAEALRLADRYRADFPSGELAPEAEVVAIEALVERGEKPRASERAARFLARYPGDPHTARVKWLVR